MTNVAEIMLKLHNVGLHRRAQNAFPFKVYLRAGWATLLRGAELVVPTKEAGRGRPLRTMLEVEAVGVTAPPGGLLSKGIPLLLPALLLFRDWRLMEVGMDGEPLMVGLT